MCCINEKEDKRKEQKKSEGKCLFRNYNDSKEKLSWKSPNYTLLERK